MRWKVYKHAHPGECWFQGEAYGKLLQVARQKTGLNTREFEERVGKIPVGTISGVECGRQVNIAPEHLKRILKTLKTTEDKLFGRQAQVDQFLVDAVKLEYLGTCEGTIDDAMEYGRRKADIDQGSILAVPEGKDPPDLTGWAKDTLAYRHGISEKRESRRRRSNEGYRERIASKGVYEEGIAMRRRDET